MARRIIIRVPNWLGDAIMATGAVDAFHQQRPDDTITLIGPPAILTVFSSSYNPYNLIPYDREKKDAGLIGLSRLSGMLRDEYHDAGYLLTNSFSSAFMFYLGRIPERIGYRGQLRTFLLTEAVDSLPEATHQAQQYSYLLTRQNGEIPAPTICISPDERERARQILEEKECLGQVRIGVAPGAAYGPAKRWPPEYFAELARECIKRLDARILIFGSKNEWDLAENIQQQVGERAINLAGKTTLRQLLSLIQQCRVIITNDSGTMHASTAVKTPVIAIFGSTDPQKTSPLGPNNRVIYEKIDCSPCFKRTCPYGHYECLKRITPKSVLKPIEELLSLREAK